MILDTTTKTVRAYLAGAPAANQPEYNVSWADHKPTVRLLTPGHDSGVLTGVTPKTLILAPGAGEQRNVKGVWIFNADSAAITLTVDVYNINAARRWVRAVLETLWTLAWEYGGTWHVYDENGIVQGTGGGGTPVTEITVEEVDGDPTYPATTKLQFDQADGFVVSQPVAGTARVDSTGTPAPDQEARFLAFWRFFNGRGL